jgi:hypothetical protein
MSTKSRFAADLLDELNNASSGPNPWLNEPSDVVKNETRNIGTECTILMGVNVEEEYEFGVFDPSAGPNGGRVTTPGCRITFHFETPLIDEEGNITYYPWSTMGNCYSFPYDTSALNRGEERVEKQLKGMLIRAGEVNSFFKAFGLDTDGVDMIENANLLDAICKEEFDNDTKTPARYVIVQKSIRDNHKGERWDRYVKCVRTTADFEENHF